MNYKVNCRLYMIITTQVSLPFAYDLVMYHSSKVKNDIATARYAMFRETIHDRSRASVKQLQTNNAVVPVAEKRNHRRRIEF